MTKHQQIVNKDTDIAVIGLGFKFPGDSNEPQEFWKNLKSGYDSVKEVPTERYSKNYSILGEISSNSAALLELDEWKNFDPLFFGIAPSEASTIDPQGRVSLMCTYESLEDAYLDPVELRGSNTSIFIGCYTLDYQFNLKDRSNGSPNIFNANMHYLANRISYCFDFRGQSVTMDTACSSSSNAIIAGIQSIINGDSNLSICGGTNFIMDPFTSKMLSAVNMMGKTGKCMSFDEKCDGFARSEGCGMVVLKKLSDAIKDGNKIYCVIKGYSSNVDGNFEKTSLFAPSVNGQFDNIEKTFKSTRGTVLPIDIDYVEAHGTGTPVGDPVEVESISLALKTSTTRSESFPLLIGSLKSNLGHTESASGVASLIKCCLMFKHRIFTPNANFNKPNPAIHFKKWNIKVVTEPIEFPSNKQVSMILNNFGATASNTCFILSEYIENQNGKTNDVAHFLSNCIQPNKEYLIPFSSNSKKSLELYKQKILNNFVGKIEFNDFLIKQIYTKTNKLNQRSVIVSKSNWNGFNDFNEKYSTESTKSFNIISKSIDPTVVFIFSGQGPQFNRMGIELYENEPVFRESMIEIDNLFKPYYGYSVFEKLRSIKDDDKYSINIPSILSPPLLMIQISLFKLLKHWGINPSFIVGHSFGEIPMAYASGMIDLETVVKIVYIRSKLQEKTSGAGKMLSISMSHDQYVADYSSQYPLIEIACINSQNSIVLSGNEMKLVEISKKLNERSIQNVFLGAISSLHSSSQSIFKDELIGMEKFKCYSPKIHSFSTVTSKLFKHEEFTYEYLYRNIREPVQFEKTINNLYNHIESSNIGNGSVVFIEISPHPVLSYYLKELIPNNSNFFSKESIIILQTLNRKKNDVKEIQKTISKLYCHGYNINFKCQFDANHKILNGRAISKLSSIELPRYQWDLQPYWSETIQSLKSRVEGAPITIMGSSNDTPFISKTTFIDIKKEPFKYLGGHLVKDSVYFPGCGYIDIILNIFPNQDLIINYLEFNSPFILNESDNLEMTSNLIRTSINKYKTTFNIRDKKTDSWIQTSNGNITIYKNEMISPSPLSPFKDIESLKNEFNYCHISKSDFYQHVKKTTSINYQDCFQRVEDCWIGKDNSSLIKVSTKQLISKQDNQFFNASILDCCFHGFISSITDPCVIVFDKVENLRIYSSNIPTFKQNGEEQFIYVLSKPKSKYSDSFSGELVAFLENGKILFEAENSVCTSLTPVSNSLMIEYPKDELYSFCLEPKDSQIPHLQEFKYLYGMDKYQVSKIDDLENCLEIIPNLFYYFISNRIDITSETLINSTIDQLVKLYSNENNEKLSKLLKFVFTTIKSKDNFSIDNFKSSSSYFSKILIKTTKIISKLLFPLDSDDSYTDTPQSLFENSLLDNIYSKANGIENNLLLVSKVLSDSIENVINNKCVVRILEIGGGTASLSENVIYEINNLICKNQNVNVLVEFTFTDISPNFIPDAKLKLYSIIKKSGGFNSNISLLFKTFDLEKSYSEQSFKPSYYNFIVFSNVLHVVKDVGFGLHQIYSLLAPNGHLIFIEPPPSIYLDSIFGCFEQWWSFTDTHIRKDRCCMNQEKWMDILPNYGFNEFITSNSHNSTVPFIIHTQKQKLIDSQTTISTTTNLDYNIIIYTGTFLNEPSIVYFINLISNSLFSKSHCNISIVSTIKEFETQVDSLKNNERSIIFFVAPVEALQFKNINEISLELYLIGRNIWDNNKTDIKITTISIDSSQESKNYLNSSVLGVMKYFEDSPITVFSFDFDKMSFYNENTILSVLNSLFLNSKNHIQIEYIIRDNKVYTERIYREEINKSFSNKIKNQKSNNEEFYARLNPQLQYELQYKPILKDNEVEIKILATGINMKDHLNYQGLIPKELSLGKRNINDKIPGFGGEFSGIITKVGKNVKEFKIGDNVFGMAFPTTSSHVNVDVTSCCIILKPQSITHKQAASIPLVYLSSYLSIFNIGNLDIEEEESILIHSASGGVGLSSLEILKWKGHNAHIFVTVGSIEKQQFLKDKYGDFITGIYSTRNTGYVNEIKLKLKELGSNKLGVDLILNTLSSNEFMDANFKCLNQGGRIVDLSITHLSHSNYTDFNKFKYFFGYHSFELGYAQNKTMKKILNQISIAMTNNQLKLIDPISFYPVENIKDVIESFSNRTHIGKIVVEINKDLVGSLNSNNNSIIIDKLNYKINNNLGKTILVTGQVGIILDILKWITSVSTINSTIENIIILSFSELKWELKLLINQTIERLGGKIKFYFKSVDVGNYKLLNMAIDQILNENKENESLSNVNSIFHFAFKNLVTKLTDVGISDFEISNSTKVIGAINFHNISIERNWKLKNFVLSSSVASVVVHVGSPSYVSANNVLDSLSRYRKSLCLPCTTINIGLILSTGIVTSLKLTGEVIKSKGIKPIKTNLIFGLLDLILGGDENNSIDLCHNAMLCDFNLNGSKSFIEGIKFSYKFDYYTNQIQLKNNLFEDSNSNDIDNILIKMISELLTIEPSLLNTDIKLSDYGADSLISTQFKNLIDKQFYPNILTLAQIQSLKIKSFIQIIIKSLDEKQNQKQNSTKEIYSDSSSSMFKLISGSNSVKFKMDLDFWKKEIEFEEYNKLTANLSPYSFELIESPTINHGVLLTGATGYLGVYLLYHLIRLDNCSIVYCTVRNKSSEESALQKLIENLKHHKLYDNLNQRHLNKISVLLISDLSDKYFGLSEELKYQSLSNSINLIIHCAANTSLITDYPEAKETNIGAIKEMIKFAFNKSIKRFVNFSSITVFYNDYSFDNQFDEKIWPRLENQSNLAGYQQSKVISEVIQKNASVNGLPSILIRPPSISCNSETGIGNTNDAFLLFIQCCFIENCIPNIIPHILFIVSPINWIAENSMNLIFNDQSWKQSTDNLTVYNLHTDSLKTNDLVDFIRNTNDSFSKINLIEYDEWKSKILNSKHEICKRYTTFHTLEFNNSYSEHVKLSENTKSILIQKNSNLNPEQVIKSGEIQKYMIDNHLNFIFNK